MQAAPALYILPENLHKNNISAHSVPEDGDFMDLYNQLLPLGMALAILDDDVFTRRSGPMTEAEKEELINRARDSRSGEALAVVLNQLTDSGTQTF